MSVTYGREIANGTTVYERKLTLLPVKIEGKVYVFFPSRQIGFTGRSDKAPDRLEIMCQGKKITKGWINKGVDLIAIPLRDYQGKSYMPYLSDTPLAQLIPALLALRNNGDASFSDTGRRLYTSSFSVNSDFLELKVDGARTCVWTGF